MHLLTGPVRVEGAMPGDVLALDILDIRLRQNLGFTLILPLWGTLPEDFPEPELVHILLDKSAGTAQLQWGGVALQGEVTYRQDVPLQFDDVELLFAALTPFEQGLATLRGTPLPTTCPEGVPAASTLTHCGQLGGHREIINPTTLQA